MSVCCTYKNTSGLHRSVCLKQHREGSSPSTSRGHPQTAHTAAVWGQEGTMPHILLGGRGRQPPPQPSTGGPLLREHPSPKQTAAAGLVHTPITPNTKSILQPWCREHISVGCAGTRTPKGKVCSWTVPSPAQAWGSALILQEELGTEHPAKALRAMGNVTGKRYTVSVYFCMARGVVYQRPSSQHCNIPASSPCPCADTEPTPATTQQQPRSLWEALERL